MEPSGRWIVGFRRLLASRSGWGPRRGNRILVLSVAILAWGEATRAAPAPPVQPVTTVTLVVTQPPPPDASTPNETKRQPVPTPPAKPTPVPAQTPRPTRTPQPTPAQRPFVYRFVPPLSPEQARGLVRACVDVLTIKDPSTVAARCRKAIEIIDATSTYLTILDQRQSTLDSYKWYFIDREKVGPGLDHDVYRAQPNLANASAISFAADSGDIYIYWVSVCDANGDITTFTLNRLVEQNYPREEICYLFLPRTIQSVSVKYEARRHRSRIPRMTVFGGVARKEEYLKQTLWYLRYARREIQAAARDPVASAAHTEAACENLRQAASRLIRFRVKGKL